MSNKFSNIKERILYLAENQEGNKQIFCKKIGVTYGNFTGKNKETPISSTTIENILLNYPETNLYWLITGEGEVLKLEPKKEVVLETDSIYLKKLIEMQEGEIERLKKEVIYLKKEKAASKDCLYVAEPSEELKKEPKNK